MRTPSFLGAAAAVLFSVNINAQSPATGTINGHDYVDLGLSVKWATCNVGADKPEDYGNYYAWGDTTVVDDFTSSGRKYDFSVRARNDPAKSNWGAEWRRPNIREFVELRDSCQWQWITVGDHQGYKITGPNGNSIFLPAAGHRCGSSQCNAGVWGCYWSTGYGLSCYSTASLEVCDMCYLLLFYEGYYHTCCVGDNKQRSIRPVTDNNQ